MSDASFQMFTDEERQSVAYAACTGGAAVAAITASRVTGGDGVLVETAARAAFTLMATNRLAPSTKQKFFFRAALLSESEILLGLQAVRDAQPALGKLEALRVLAAARMEIAHNPAKYRIVAPPRQKPESAPGADSPTGG